MAGQASGAGYLDRLLAGAAAVLALRNGSASMGMFDKLDVIGGTATYDPPSGSEAAGTLHLTLASGGAPDWNIGSGAVSPTHIVVQDGIGRSYDSGSGTLTLSIPLATDSVSGLMSNVDKSKLDSITIPSAEIYWSSWSTMVGISTETSHQVSSIDLTDTGKSGQIWVYGIELECQMHLQSDATVCGRMTNELSVRATYNSSGVPSLVTISEGANAAQRSWQMNSYGLPGFIDVEFGTASGAVIPIMAIKNSGGSSTYAKARYRLASQFPVGPTP